LTIPLSFRKRVCPCLLAALFSVGAGCTSGSGPNAPTSSGGARTETGGGTIAAGGVIAEITAADLQAIDAGQVAMVPGPMSAGDLRAVIVDKLGIGFLLDQNAVAGGVFVRFLGRWACTFATAGMLAARGNREATWADMMKRAVKLEFDTRGLKT